MTEQEDTDDLEPLDDDILLEEMVRAIVGRPGDVVIEVRSSDQGTRQLHVLVHSEDRGKVIGKNGRMADTLRAFMSAVGARRRTKIQVMVEAGPGRDPGRRRVRSGDGTSPRPPH